MTTYNTYQKAKLDNPSEDIYTNGFFFDIREAWNMEYKSVSICNPADHCMAVEKFKDSGKRLIDGDLYINLDGNVITYEARLGLGVDRDSSQNSRRYILKAAALEEKPKRVKVEYELLCNTNFNVWGLKELLNNGDLFYLINEEYVVVPSGSDIFAIEHFLSGNIYRRVETEFLELDDFVGRAAAIADYIDSEPSILLLEAMFEAGCRFTD